MKINVKEDLKELVNFESNKDDIRMVNAAGDVKEDKYDGPTYLAIFTWIYALCTSRYKTPRLFGEIFKYTLYVWVVGLVLMFLLGVVLGTVLLLCWTFIFVFGASFLGAACTSRY
ncbi:hypothetical protein N219_10405 [Limosilactobacillus fermentum MTCC 8711]|nr:hypothetical protein N219_10405 [Limosilactobacillus fermentum MTCC 8711]